jgi:TRAP-type C4-dicarboxylate transport system permease large subunit
LRDLSRLVADSAAAVGAVLLMLALAIGVLVLTAEQESLTDLMSWIQTSGHFRGHFRLLLLLMVNALLLVVGVAIDPLMAVVIVAPFIVRLTGGSEIDPYHLMSVVLLNLAIGCLARPVAHDLFLAPRSGLPAGRPYREVAPFIGVLVVALLLTTCLQAVATWLPYRVFPRPDQPELSVPR